MILEPERLLRGIEMGSSNFWGNLFEGFRAISGRGVQAAMWIAGLTASANALRVSYTRGYLACHNSDEYLTCRGIYGRHGDYREWLNFQNLEITALLFVFVVGLLLRKRLGFLLSLAALLWIGKIYLWWRLSTVAFLRMAEIPNYPLLEGLKRQHLDFLLREAIWWDMVVLTVCIILFAWQLKAIITVVRASRWT